MDLDLIIAQCRAGDELALHRPAGLPAGEKEMVMPRPGDGGVVAADSPERETKLEVRDLAKNASAVIGSPEAKGTLDNVNGTLEEMQSLMSGIQTSVRTLHRQSALL